MRQQLQQVSRQKHRGTVVGTRMRSTEALCKVDDGYGKRALMADQTALC